MTEVSDPRPEDYGLPADYVIERVPTPPPDADAGPVVSVDVLVFRRPEDPA